MSSFLPNDSVVFTPFTSYVCLSVVKRSERAKYFMIETENFIIILSNLLLLIEKKSILKMHSYLLYPFL